MANVDETLDALIGVSGSKCVALVDSRTGMILGQRGSAIDIDLAAAGNTEVVRANLNMIKSLGLSDKIEDILITLSSQYHVMRPLKQDGSIFLYLVLDRVKSNLAMARHKVSASGDTLTV